MPSAAKRRKAIKKKKEKEAKQISANPHHPLRNEDDGVKSPPSPDHEKSDEPLGESAKEVSGNAEVSRKSGVEDEVSIVIQHEPKTDQNIEIADSASSSSSSSHCSDDESHETEKTSEKETNQDLVVEPIQLTDLDKPDISLPENAEEVAVNVPLPDATANLILDVVPVDDSSKPLVSENKKQTSVMAFTENIPEVPNDVKPVLTENKERLSDAAVNRLSGTGVMVKDLPISDNKPEASSAATGISVKEYEDGTLTLSNSVGESTNTLENVEGPRIAESKKETPALRVAQRTTWLSCCGLFDVMAGSGR